jgi:hypothetical protein
MIFSHSLKLLFKSIYNATFIILKSDETFKREHFFSSISSWIRNTLEMNFI